MFLVVSTLSSVDAGNRRSHSKPTKDLGENKENNALDKPMSNGISKLDIYFIKYIITYCKLARILICIHLPS